MKYRLKQEYIKAIKNNPVLYGRIAEVLGISVYSMNYNLNNIPDNFTKKAVLKIMSDVLKVSEDELIEPLLESENA